VRLLLFLKQVNVIIIPVATFSPMIIVVVMIVLIVIASG